MLCSSPPIDKRPQCTPVNPRPTRFAFVSAHHVHQKTDAVPAARQPVTRRVKKKQANNQMSSKPVTEPKKKPCTKLAPIDSCPNCVHVRFWLGGDRMKRSHSRTGGSHRIQRSRGAALKDPRPSSIKSKAGLFPWAIKLRSGGINGRTECQLRPVLAAPNGP